MVRSGGVRSLWVVWGLLCFLTPSVMGATGDPQAPRAPRTHARAGAIRTVQPTANVDSVGTDSADDPESRPLPRYHKPVPVAPADEDSGGLAMNVAGKLALVVALILACAAAWKRFQGGVPQVVGAQGQAVKITSTVPLGPQRFLHLVNVGRHQLLLASSPQSVALIATLDASSTLLSAHGPAVFAQTPPHGAPESPEEPYDEFGEGTDPSVSPADRFEELLVRLRELEGDPADRRVASDGTRAQRPHDRPVLRTGRSADRGEERSAISDQRSAPLSDYPLPTAHSPLSSGLSGDCELTTARGAGAFAPGSLFRSSGRVPRGGADA